MKHNIFFLISTICMLGSVFMAFVGLMFELPTTGKVAKTMLSLIFISFLCAIIGVIKNY